MSDITTMTKAALIEEVLRLRQQYEDCSETNGSNGKFEEDALFGFAETDEGEELYVVTETGRFVFVNDTALSRLGYAAEEMLAMSLPRIDPNNTRATWLARVSRMRQSGEPDVFETEYVGKDGNRQAREITARYISYRSRNYVLCIGKSIERMEGKRSPAATDHTREQVLFRVTSDGVIIVDTRGIITESNAVADRLLGIPKSEMIGRSCVDGRWRLVDSGGSPLGISNHPMMIAMVEEEIVANRRISMMPIDGPPRIMMINAAPLYDDSGSLTGAIGCIRPFEDVAERRESMLRENISHAQYREIVEAVLYSDSEDVLERRVCESLVRHSDYPLVWRGVTKSTDERFYPSASAGEASEYLMRIKIRYDDSEYGNGPLGRAFKTGKPVVVHDLAKDESYKPWRDQAIRSGLHSLAVFPLIHDGEELGVFACYAGESNHFNDSEFRNVEEIARLLVFGIAMCRHREADRARKGEYHTLRTIVHGYEELLPVAIARFAMREPFRCETTNTQFSAILDEPYHSMGAEGYFASDFMHASYHRDLYQQLALAAKESTTVGRDRDIFTDWEGTQMRWSWRILPVSGESGEEQLVYLAYRHETGPATQDSSPRQDSPLGEVLPAHEASAKDDDPAVLHIAAPRFGSRSKPETKLARFLEEGTILRINRAAATRFGADGDMTDTKPDMLFDEGMHDALKDMLSIRESGAGITIPSRDGVMQHAFRVYLTTTDDTQEYVLISE